MGGLISWRWKNKDNNIVIKHLCLFGLIKRFTDYVILLKPTKICKLLIKGAFIILILINYSSY